MMTEIDNCYKGSKLPWCEIESDIESESEFGDEEFFERACHQADIFLWLVVQVTVLEHQVDVVDTLFGGPGGFKL